MDAHTLYTIGHSNHTIERFLLLLTALGVRKAVDIRSMPRSRYNPQFNAEALAASLPSAGILYTQMKDLGGRRTAHPDSPNAGFHEGGFRGYADYMQTPVFAAALASLIEQSRALPLAIMCAEGDPMHCHRSLVSDALVAQAVEVRHILPSGDIAPHRLRDFARVTGTRVDYPPVQPRLL